MTKALDFESLTLGEAAFIEDYSGRALESFGDKTAPKMKMLVALATVAQRRNGFPKYSLLEATMLTPDQANAIIQGDEEPADVAEALVVDEADEALGK